MIIKNGLFFTEKEFIKQDIIYYDGKIVSMAKPNDKDIIDASGLYIIPGLTDIHTHGAVGYDFCTTDIDGLRKIAEYEYSSGVTTFCPTSMTLPFDILKNIYANIPKISRIFEVSPTCARIPGINMEGPFISSAKKGAQKELYIKNPNFEMFKELSKSCNDMIKLVTVAPELPGSADFIRAVKSYYSTSVSLDHSACTYVSLGHSACTYEQAETAFKCGADHVTHMFNAMSFNHREPGIPAAAADMDNIYVELICDGIHLHPSIIRNVFRIFGSDRVILISDSMEACGMPDGQYTLGEQAVYKNGSYATLKDGTLAGSATNLFDCMKNAVKFGISLHSAVKAATINPARSIGISIENAYSDLLLIDKNLDIIKIIRH